LIETASDTAGHAGTCKPVEHGSLDFTKPAGGRLRFERIRPVVAPSQFVRYAGRNAEALEDLRLDTSAGAAIRHVDGHQTANTTRVDAIEDCALDCVLGAAAAHRLAIRERTECR
jgi:hypothetical protein